MKIASDNAQDSKTWGGDELEDWLLGKSASCSDKNGSVHIKGNADAIQLAKKEIEASSTMAHLNLK